MNASAASLFRPGAAPEPDGELLARFAATRDEAAFTAVVDRHAAMVLGACRRMLGDHQRAEDACQATFVVLARKAARVRWQASAAGWLHAVARRVCLKARSRAGKAVAVPLPSDLPGPAGEPTVADLRAVLDDELNRLPATYRQALILCHLEGRTADEACRILACTDGQLRGWLQRGREKLHARLTRRGIVMPTALLTLVLAQTSTAAPSAAAFQVLVHAATGTAPAAADALATGVMHAMLFEKLRGLAAAAVVVVLGAGVALRPAEAGPGPGPAAIAAPSPAAPQRDDDKKGDAEKADQVLEGDVLGVEGSAFTAAFEDGKVKTAYSFAEGVKGFFLGRPMNRSELRPGMRVKLSFKGIERNPFRIDAAWPKIACKIAAVDVLKLSKTVTVTPNGANVLDVTLGVTRDTKFLLDGLIVEAADAEVGMEADLHLAADKKTIARLDLEADPQDLAGVIKAIKVGESLTLTVSVEARERHRQVDLTFAAILLQKLTVDGASATVDKLKPGMHALVRLGSDRRTVAKVWAVTPAPGDKDDD